MNRMNPTCKCGAEGTIFHRNRMMCEQCRAVMLNGHHPIARKSRKSSERRAAFCGVRESKTIPKHAYDEELPSRKFTGLVTVSEDAVIVVGHGRYVLKL